MCCNSNLKSINISIDCGGCGIRDNMKTIDASLNEARQWSYGIRQSTDCLPACLFIDTFLARTYCHSGKQCTPSGNIRLGFWLRWDFHWNVTNNSSIQLLIKTPFLTLWYFEYLWIILANQALHSIPLIHQSRANIGFLHDH